MTGSCNETGIRHIGFPASFNCLHQNSRDKKCEHILSILVKRPEPDELNNVCITQFNIPPQSPLPQPGERKAKT